MNNQRNTQRVDLIIPIHLSFGSQITLLGQIKDISLKSAFITIKSSSIHMDIHDDLLFSIENLPNNPEAKIHGSARISRVAPGEGIAIYFTKMDESSSNHLQRLVGN